MRKSIRKARSLETLLALPPTDLVTSGEAALVIGVTREAVRYAIHYSLLPAQLLGKTALITIGDALSYRNHRTFRGWPKGKLRKAA